MPFTWNDEGDFLRPGFCRLGDNKLMIHESGSEAVSFGREGPGATHLAAVSGVPLSGELLRFKEDVSVSSSGIVANSFKTCLSAGRRMGLLVIYQQLDSEYNNG